jgi:quercetin dioxygenase-like cupin family protein
MKGGLMDALASTWDWSEVEAFEAYPGISRQTLTGRSATLVRYIYQPGSVFPPHAHPDEQLTVVHSGVIEFEVDGRAVTLRAGQVAVIAGGVPHGARVVGDEVVVTDNYFASAQRAPIVVRATP